MKLKRVLLANVLIGLIALSGCSESLQEAQPTSTADDNLNGPPSTSEQEIFTPILVSSTPEPPINTPTFTPALLITPSPTNSTSVLLELISSEKPNPNDEQYLYAHLEDDGSYVSLDPEMPGVSGPDFPLTNYLGKAVRLSFANVRNLIAYLDFENNFWIADLTNHYRVLIYTDQSKPLSHVELIWTPDDHHLIIDYENPDKSDLIYHLISDEIDEWNFTCDRLAVSPLTRQVVSWCASTNDESSQFAVLEWGQEIWYSDTPPITELVQAELEFNKDTRFRRFPLYRNVGWSSEGTFIAFFDPQDLGGALSIINSQREIQSQIPGRAYWISELDKNRGYLPGKPIQWSTNDKRILVFAVGEANHPCPEEVIDAGPLAGKYINPACWQVIDVETGKTLWRLSDLTSQEAVGRLRQFHTYEEPTLSQNGQLLAIYSFAAADIKLYFINVDTGEVLLSPAFRTLKMRWGTKE